MNSEKGFKEIKEKAQSNVHDMFEAILQVMKEKHITTDMLSEMTGVDKTTLNHILQSEQNFMRDALHGDVMRIKDVLDGPIMIVRGKMYYLAPRELRILSTFSSETSN